MTIVGPPAIDVTGLADARASSGLGSGRRDSALSQESAVVWQVAAYAADPKFMRLAHLTFGGLAAGVATDPVTEPARPGTLTAASSLQLSGRKDVP